MTPLPIRIAIYARYSSDIQSPTSIEDQITICEEFISRHFQNVPVEVTVFNDAA
jgi:DNA invertase Pin-like site-specific DNA recombinase